MMRKSMTPSARQRLMASALGASLLVVTVALAGCEDKAIGRKCDVQGDAGAMQAVFNGQALECPSRICMKPSAVAGSIAATAAASTSGPNTTTAAYCTAECSKDSDCDGETRDPRATDDRRCVSGFVCGVAFEVGPLCCKKLCLCKDFIDPKKGLQGPVSCDKRVSTCQNL